MMLNNRGFTLIELLAVVAIIALLGGIAVPSVLSSINKGKNASYNILVSNIVTASSTLYNEVEYGGSDIYKYDGQSGNVSSERVVISGKSISTNLQTLVSNGFLTTGTTNESDGRKILRNPMDDVNIGNCEIRIVKVVNGSSKKTSYRVEKVSGGSSCPASYSE